MNGAVRTARADAPATPERTPHTAAPGCADDDALPHTSHTDGQSGDPSVASDHTGQLKKLAVVVRPVVHPVDLNDAICVDLLAVGTDEHVTVLAGDGLIASGEPATGQRVGGEVEGAHVLIQPQTPHTVNHKLSAVVLFEGAGGSTAGLHAAGYTTVGFDCWQPAVTCAQANGFDSRLHDLSDPTLDHLVPYAPLWWASPPCQPFSAAGQGVGEFDGRDGFPWLLRLVALRLPEVLIVENVKGLTFAKHSGYLCDLLEGLRALGYEVDWRVLMAADFGVPQTRERCIIVCRRDGGPITWPMPTHCETGGMFTARWVTMADALGWYDSDFMLSPGASESQPNRPLVSGHSPAPMIAFGNDAARWRWRPAPSIAPGKTGNGDLWHGFGRDMPRVSVAQAATLQGFPPEWTWGSASLTAQYRMIGNAVPPALAAAVANVNQPLVVEVAA